jgi:3,4-dihydroxy-2-butanone 4-phosphate synthase
VFDTRPGEGGLRTVSKQKISGATELRVKLTDLSGLVPASGVGAVSLNVTVTQPDGAGYVTVYPCGTKPNASSLNYTAGQTIPNAVIAPVSAQGEVCFFSTQPTHILADVNGWFASGSSFTSVSPSRVFDTRPGEGGLRTVSKQKISGATELRVKLTNLSGLVPASGVGAVSLNVTVTQPDGAGYVTVYPCGTKPNASSLNYTAGQTIPNAVIAPVSAQGEVCFFSTQPTHILADVNGWFASGSSFTSVSPSRVFDTRPGEGGLRTVSKQKISGATELRVKLTNLSGLVPASGVGAVSLNVTVTQPDGAGYVTVYPCGTKPNASSLNYVAGETIPNAVIAPVSAQGEVCFFSTQPTHILADVNGWFSN